MSETDDAPTVALLRRAADRQTSPGTVDLDEVLRAGARRRQRAARTRAVVGSAAATAVLVTAIAVGAAVVGGSGVDQGPLQAADGPGDLLALLDRPATADDELPTVWPEGGELAVTGVDEESTRLVGTLEESAFYAGTDDGDVCLLVLTPDSVVSSCADPGRFAEEGVWVAGAGPSGQQAIGVLLPDRLAGRDVVALPRPVREAGGYTFGEDDLVAPNLLASTDYDQELCCAP